MAIVRHIKTINLELTVTLDAYTAGDVVGGLLTIPVHNAGGGGVLRRLITVDEDAQSEGYTLYLFDQLPSTIANDAAFAPTIADLRKLIGTVTIAAGDYVTVNSLVYTIDEVDLEFTAANGNLYGYLVATDTPDYANADAVYLRFVVDLDA